MKIALAQLNYHIGNFSRNEELIIKAIIEAKEASVDLVVFSELSICGYPPQDLLEHKSFITSCESTIHSIVKACQDIAVIVGAPTINNNEKGKPLFNSAYFINNGQIEKIIHKTLLPTYDIFDEYRYFEPNKVFEIILFREHKIALTICEDLWYDQPALYDTAKSKLYNISPLKELNKLSPDIIINISASPFSYRQEMIKRDIFINNAKKYKLPLVYVNQVGANTELIFDGNSAVINSRGEIVKRLDTFNTDLKIVDTSEIDNLPPITRLNMNNEEIRIKHIYDALVLGVKDYFRKMGFTDAILGLSGGIDSAVTLAIAVAALGKKHIRVMLMPSKYSSEHSISDSVEMAENLDIKYDIVSIKDVVTSYSSTMKEMFKNTEEDITEENIQARIRGTLLMAVSNKFNCILLNTSNKSEAAVGYGTLYGDMNGGLSVLGDVYKTDVYKLARYINLKEEIIPNNIIIKPPSAELRPDQKDTDSLPEYDVLDQILYNYIELRKSAISIIKENNFDKNTVNWVIKQVNRNEYKRFQTPPILRISSKAFGFGRRMPLVAKYPS